MPGLRAWWGFEADRRANNLIAAAHALWMPRRSYPHSGQYIPAGIAAPGAAVLTDASIALIVEPFPFTMPP